MRRTWLGPLALCRLDSDLIARIREEDSLAGLIAETFLWMTLGAACYGAVLGGWRAPVQGLYAATKLPLLLAALVVTTTAANSVFAQLVGSRLRTKQVLAACLLSMAILAILLASISPISALIAFSIEGYGESMVGQSGEAARSATRVAERLLAYHVFVIAGAGLMSLSALRRLIEALVGSPERTRAFLWLSLSAQAIAGTQLSWILRPYLGKPGLAVSWLRPDAFAGSFFEEVGRWLVGS